MERRRSRGEAEIEALLAKLPPGSDRHACLSAARDFKASWVALGDRLTKLRETGQYAQWGYKTFEAYVRNELRMKPDTANKLTRSYSFLRDHEPEALSAPIARELPPLDVVDLLSRAREKAKVSDEQFDNIRHEAFDADEGPMTRSEVMKRFREIDPDAFKPQPKKAGGAVAADGNVRKALLLAERLESLLVAIQGLSEDAQRHAQSVTVELRTIFLETQQQQPEANAA
ncbi:MAG: hypothetical protein ACAI38_01030 [Myxococcota bacterium]|nr:hypothetical protein [Myxococcota bacterium]